MEPQQQPTSYAPQQPQSYTPQQLAPITNNPIPPTPSQPMPQHKKVGPIIVGVIIVLIIVGLAIYFLAGYVGNQPRIIDEISQSAQKQNTDSTAAAVNGADDVQSLMNDLNNTTSVDNLSI